MKYLPAGLSIGFLSIAVVFTLSLVFASSFRSPAVRLNINIGGLGPRQECVSTFHVSVDGRDQVVAALKPMTSVSVAVPKGYHHFAVTAAHDYSSRQADGVTSRGIYAYILGTVVEGDQDLTIYFNSPLVADPEAMSEICSK